MGYTTQLNAVPCLSIHSYLGWGRRRKRGEGCTWKEEAFELSDPGSFEYERGAVFLNSDGQAVKEEMNSGRPGTGKPEVQEGRMGGISLSYSN